MARCASPDFETHLVFIEPVLYRLLGAGLKLKPLKCPFLKRQVTYSGHVSAIGVKSDPKNEKALIDFTRLKFVLQGWECLGHREYYRRHIRDFSKVAKTTSSLTSPWSIFQWGKDNKKAFSDLKMKLILVPIVRYPDF